VSKSTTNSSGANLIIAVVVTLAVAGGGGFMLGHRTGEKSIDMETKAVAVVNNKTITQMELYNRLVKQGGAEVVDKMIDEVLVEQEAVKAGVKVTAADVDRELALIQDRFGGAQALNEALTQYSMTMEDLRSDLEMRTKMTQIVTKDLPVDDNVLSEYFATKADLFDQREVTSRHILLETQEEAVEVRSLLAGGADFATLAKERSTEPAAAESGGDLGSNTRGKMVPEFDAVVFNMAKGEISDPFQTEFGWHVVEVMEIKGAAPTFDAMKEQVKSAYLDERAQDLIPEWIEEIRAKAKIENKLAAAAQ
jgi:foldase protein PrsA